MHDRRADSAPAPLGASILAELEDTPEPPESDWPEPTAVVTTPSRNRATVQPLLAQDRDILARFAAELVAVGVAGERRAGCLIYLVVVSRFLPRIVSLAVKGPSAGRASSPRPS